MNPNEPLKRSDFELISTVNHNGTAANTNLTHEINVPIDRSGYHVILGVWDVADTPNAFYNVIDVNLINGEEVDKEPPTAPASVEALNVTDRMVELSWNKSMDNQGIKEYEIYRNGEKVATTMNTVYKDAGVKPDTSYEYYVKAIDLSGNTSSASKAVAVKTLKPVEDMEAPTPPSGLHSMKESESSIELMWSPSEDQVGVKEYAVYRDGQLVATTATTYYIDKNLKPDTSYTYTVFAIDGAGNVSDSSSPLEVSTLKSDSSVEEWSEEKVYTAGMIVQFKGLEYKAKYWTKGNQPDSSDAWELVSDTVVEWNAQKAYPSGSKVNYGNRTYEAQWWTLGDTPGTSVVWKVVE
ncbi:fibronectin type III domain-containing protein [Priestia flexa]|uniref:fibronectin type III domain-containing protein n=1 Tax=Priestia flexa TaxID=86664 RepID=UPI003FD0CC8F